VLFIATSLIVHIFTSREKEGYPTFNVVYTLFLMFTELEDICKYNVRSTIYNKAVFDAWKCN